MADPPGNGLSIGQVSSIAQCAVQLLRGCPVTRLTIGAMELADGIGAIVPALGLFAKIRKSTVVVAIWLR
jgi:hypothetical protein